MDVVTQLSTTLENMSMEDVLLVLKDVQLKNQALQEQNCRLLTAPTVHPNVTGSPTPTQDSLSGRAEGSANDSAPRTDVSALFVSKESRKELEYCAMKMVIFAHVWWEKKGLFGIGLDSESARRKLDAATLTNSLDTGVQRPSQDRVMVLCLVLKLYEFLPEAFHPVVGATMAGEYKKLFKIMKDVGGVRRSTFLNRFRNVAAEIFEGDVPQGHFRQGFDRSEDPLCQHLSGYKLAKILTCLLWGSTALDDQPIATKGTNGDLWHITEVNSAAIAFAAIVIRYLLTGDPEFTPIGKISGINYMADFEYYVERIEDQLKKGTKSMHDTLKAPTTIPISLTEKEENFWHELEAIDKEADLDSDGTDQTLMAPVVSVNAPSAIQALTAPVASMNAPSAISIEVTTPMQPVPATNEAKGKKRSRPAPRVTRATRSRGGQVHKEVVGAEAPVPPVMRKRKGGKSSAMEGPSDASVLVGRTKSPATTLAKTVTFAPLPTVVSHMAPNQETSIGNNIEQSDDDDNDDDDEEEEEEE
ncbi:hypothetical protein EV421DRAFT_1740104 [Armillaria borealis]|uniref:Uncharacterized protein n=1 Tax=Armillaria borealis TaxID=47425 RepID=A0AA39J4U2_9AGAR|nr:hypothetical protein EV421DRAFT_1740104 [Armillaria borealis]